jgi:hypothetical protein
MTPPKPPQLTDADRSLLAECVSPTRLPEKLTQRDIERLWISDRKALIECGRRHKALGEYYMDRDLRLRAEGEAA